MRLLFDIGATNTRIAFSSDGKVISDYEIFPTPRNFEEGMTLVKNIVQKHNNTEAVVLGVAGVLNKEKTMLVNALHLSDWVGKTIKEDVGKLAHAPVYIENDAIMEGLGELHYGAGKGSRIFCYITVGTGVGGARFIDGKPDIFAQGFEPGKQILSYKEEKNLEDYVSGPAIEKRFGKKPQEISDPQVWDEAANILAYGLHNTIVHWSPDTLVLGGSIMNRVSIEKTLFYLKKILSPFPELPIIKKAELGESAGLYGALYFLNSVHE